MYNPWQGKYTGNRRRINYLDWGKKPKRYASSCTLKMGKKEFKDDERTLVFLRMRIHRGRLHLSSRKYEIIMHDSFGKKKKNALKNKQISKQEILLHKSAKVCWKSHA